MNHLIETICFTECQVKACYKFAKDMIGNHNPGMIMDRTNQEIFRDVFRGKLGEVALMNYFHNYMSNVEMDDGIDYNIYPRGEWDSSDIKANGKVFNVKSVKQKSSFLMIEQFRFNSDGSYSYLNNNGDQIIIDYYILIRVIINFPEGSPAYSDGINVKLSMNDLLAVEANRVSESVYAEILGGIESYNFWKDKHSAKKGILCNYQTLRDVCNKDKVYPVANPLVYSKTQILQQDNYILHYDELKDVKTLENL